MRIKFHTLIFLCMAIGVIAGIALHFLGDEDAGWYGTVMWWLDFFGRTIFIGSLKMIIAPLIFASIVAGITSIGSFKETGRIGVKTLRYYFAATSIAVVIGLVLVLSLEPGESDASQAPRAEREVELAKHRATRAADTGLDPTLEANRGPYLAWLAEEEGQRQGTWSYCSGS